MNLLKDNVPKLVRKLALPAMVGTLFQTLYNIVDTFFAGTISPEALSALAKSFPIYFIIIAACVGVTVGGTSLIANSIGENNKSKIHGYFTHTIIYGLIVSIKHDLIPGSFSMCSGCRKPISSKDKKSKKYEEGVSCPNCHDHLKPSQKERFRMRQKQINLAKKLGKKHIFQKEF